MPNARSIRSTLGALEAGGFVSVFLSGIVAMQVYLYFKVYPKDRRYLKTLVAAIWALDFLHTIMGCVANWKYLIQHFGDDSDIDHINWSIAVTVALTAIVTFLVHCFFTHRIHVVSRGNKILTIPLAFLAFFRLMAALVSTGEMIRLASYHKFVDQFAYVFTMGLGAAVALDVFITAGLSYYLRQSKSGFSSMNDIIDSLILYTVETGMATCVTTIISLVCWVTMPHNLIFLGLHFTISKLYANSFLATLNSRATLRARSQSSSDRERSVSLPVFLSNARRNTARSRRADVELGTKPVQISVHKTVHHEHTGRLSEIELDGGPSHFDFDPDDYSTSDTRSTGAKSPPLKFTSSADAL